MTHEHEDHNVAQNTTQESTVLHDIPISAPSNQMNASFDLSMAADQFDSGVFEEEEHNEDSDEISLGFEDEDEDDVQGDG